MENKKKVRVIDSLWTFFIAVAVVGPFALPLLWRNPRFRPSTKILGTIVIALVTWFCIWFMKKSAEFATGMMGV
jgi:hypothetical protein